jgi:hypothetical protein
VIRVSTAHAATTDFLILLSCRLARTFSLIPSASITC